MRSVEVGGSDSYGAVHREIMKESMGEPFVPLNRRRQDPKGLTPLQRVIGTIIIICIATEITWQIALRVYR